MFTTSLHFPSLEIPLNAEELLHRIKQQTTREFACFLQRTFCCPKKNLGNLFKLSKCNMVFSSSIRHTMKMLSLLVVTAATTATCVYARMSKSEQQVCLFGLPSLSKFTFPQTSRNFQNSPGKCSDFFYFSQVYRSTAVFLSF